MNDPDIDPEVQYMARRVAELTAHVEVDTWHRAALRAQLMRQHQLLSDSKKRSLWDRRRALLPLKRLTLVGSPALALAVAFSIFLWTLQLSGHPAPQTAEAARITRALARTVPTVTSWQVTMQQERGETVLSSPCIVPPGNRLYIRGDRTYLFSANSGHQWVEVTGNWQHLALGRFGVQCPADFQWAFALLPGHLQQEPVSILPARPGDQEDRIEYTAGTSKGITSRVIAVVNRHTGLLTRLTRVLMRGDSVLERDTAVYRYQTAP